MPKCTPNTFTQVKKDLDQISDTLQANVGHKSLKLGRKARKPKNQTGKPDS